MSNDKPQTTLKNFIPRETGLMGPRPGMEHIPSPKRNIFYRLGVAIGLIPKTTFVNFILFEGVLWVGTNYGIFYKDTQDIFHPVRFEMSSPDLASRLRIKAEVLSMGEKIEWGSDTELMREAADKIELLRAALIECQEYLREELPITGTYFANKAFFKNVCDALEQTE